MEMNEDKNNLNVIKLYDYQKKVVKWMNDIYYNKKYNGGILQLDVGMGKTEIVIQWIFENKMMKNTMVICPSSLIQHWKEKLNRKFIYNEIKIKSFNYFRDLDLNLLNKNIKIIILDEAHFVKNDLSVLHLKLKSFIKLNQKSLELNESNPNQIFINKNNFLWLLTATCFINDISDIYNLITLINIDNKLNVNVNENENVFNLNENDNVFNLNETNQSIGIRFFEAIYNLEWKDINEIKLPELIIIDLKIKMIYDEHYKLYKFCENRLKINENNIGLYLIYLEFLQRIGNHSFYFANEDWWKIKISKTFSKMKKRKLIDLNIENNHLNQFKFNLNENTSDFVKSHLLNTISINEITLNTTSINDIGNLNEFQDIINDIQKMNSFFRNEKFEIINDLIKKHKNSKIIIFSRYLWTLKWLEYYLNWKNIKSIRIDGSMDKKIRNKKLNKIKQLHNKNILLCSLQTCGYGLDFTFSNICILIEPFWNEASEKQAYSRIYRINQNQNCIIYKIILENTADEIINKKSKEKTINKNNFYLDNEI